METSEITEILFTYTLPTKEEYNSHNTEGFKKLTLGLLEKKFANFWF